MGSASLESTNCTLKMFKEKNSRKFPKKKQNLDLSRANNYLHTIYIVLGIMSNLEMI